MDLSFSPSADMVMEKLVFVQCIRSGKFLVKTVMATEKLTRKCMI